MYIQKDWNMTSSQQVSTTETIYWVDLLPAAERMLIETKPCNNGGPCNGPEILENATQIPLSSVTSLACPQNPDNVHEHIKLIELIPLTAAILLINLAVLVFIAMNKKFHTPTYFFVTSLGIADMFVGFTCIVTVATKASDKTQELCLARIGIVISAATVSVWSLMCVAVDRYIAVTMALTYKVIMTRRRTIIGVIGTWTVSMATGFAPLIGWKDNKSTYGPYCSFMYVLPHSYIIFMFILSAILPMTIMLVIYIKLFKNAQFHIKRIQAIEKIHSPQLTSNVFGISSRTFRSIKTFAAVFGCVVVTWTPFMGATIAEMALGTCILKEIVGSHLLVLGFSNSFLNPLIYAIGTKDFRVKVRHAFKSRCYRNGSQVFPSNT